MLSLTRKQNRSHSDFLTVELSVTNKGRPPSATCRYFEGRVAGCYYKD